MYLLLLDDLTIVFFFLLHCSSLIVTLFSKIGLPSFEQKNDFKLGVGNEN